MRKPESLDQLNARVSQAVELVSDADTALSTLQRMRLPNSEVTQIRTLRYQLTDLAGKILDFIDPDDEATSDLRKLYSLQQRREAAEF